MTLSTSAVAVCCCSDSRSSLSSRVFSMAITAWLAKFSTSSICLSVNDASGRQGSDRAGARTHASKGLTLPQFGERRRQIVHRDGAVSIAFLQPQHPEFGLADAHRIRLYGLEHRPQLAWRARDDLQHL